MKSSVNDSASHASSLILRYSVANELPAIQTGERTVVDGHILTSRGAGTALDFGLLLVEKLFSAEKAVEVGRSICA